MQVLERIQQMLQQWELLLLMETEQERIQVGLQDGLELFESKTTKHVHKIKAVPEKGQLFL